MRRILYLGVSAVQIGTRNMNVEIKEYISKNPRHKKNIHFAPGIPKIDKILKGLTKNVYLTFDLDAFDPSIMPAVGTAEPGGLFWNETVDAIKKISREVNIVGADVVELSPIPGFEAPNFLAAKLVYHIILGMLRK